MIWMKKCIRKILIIVSTLLLVFNVGCESKPRVITANFLDEKIEQKVSKEGITCASASQMIAVGDFFYFVYLSSYENYGEQLDLIVLTWFNKDNPEITESRIVAESGTSIEGFNINFPYEPNITLYNSNIRIFFINDYWTEHMYYVYRDFDYNNNSFVSIGKMFINYDNSVLDFNLINYKNILKSEGISDFDENYIYPIFTSRIIDNGNKKIASITASACFPLIVSSENGFETIDIEHILRKRCGYECAIEFLGDKYFIMLRESYDNLLILNNDFNIIKSFTIEKSLTRGQVIQYNNLLYLFYSDFAVTGITDGRNNMVIGILDPDTLELYLKCYEVKNSNGLVYYSLIIAESIIYYTYSTTTLFVNNQAKDAIFFNKIRILGVNK